MVVAGFATNMPNIDKKKDLPQRAQRKRVKIKYNEKKLAQRSLRTQREYLEKSMDSPCGCPINGKKYLVLLLTGIQLKFWGVL